MSHAPAIPPAKPFRRQPRYQPMVLVVLAMMSGISLDAFLDADFRIYLAGVVIGLMSWWALRLKSSATQPRPRSHYRRESLASTSLLLGIVAISACWHHGRWNWLGRHDIGHFTGDVAIPCCLDAVATTEPRWLAPDESPAGLNYQAETVRTRVTLRVLQIRGGKSSAPTKLDDGQQARHWRSASGTIDLIIHAPTEHFRSGDTIRVFGKLAPIGPPTNPGQFDFRTYYRAKEKLASLHAYYPECVEVIQPSHGLGSRLLSSLRRRLNAMTWKYVDASEAAFASAILLGNREQLSPQRRDQFLYTGTIHLLAISGLHVGILAGSLFLFFRLGLVSRHQCLWATIAFVIFYAWLVEFRAPVSRAAILIVLYCIGRLLGESSFSYNLLAIAGIIVLVLNPMELFGMGAQLSFLAVGSLNFGKDWVFWPPPDDPIKRLIASTRPIHVRFLNGLARNLRTAFLVSGLIWFVAMPLVAFRFHLVAPVALLVNPLLLVPIAWALYGGLGVMVFGWFLPPVARIFGRFCELNLAAIEWMIGSAQSVPLSHCWTSGPTTAALIVFYLGLFFTAVFPPTKLRLKWIVILAIGWLALGWIAPDRIRDFRKRTGTNPLICTFVDVGHGTSVLVQLPDGKNILYDAGSFGSSNYGFRNVAGVLWTERIEHLDAVVISHADTDHFNALPELATRFSIGELIISPSMLASNSSVVGSVLQQITTLGIPIRTEFAGGSILEPSLPHQSSSEPPDVAPDSQEITILNPPELGTGGNDNSNSIVLLVDYEGQTILLPGDLEAAGMKAVLAKEPINCSLVMAPHHGSINSDPTEFMNWTTPKTVVISGGNRRIQENALDVFRQNGRTVYRTDQHGAVRCIIENECIETFHWDDGQWVR